MKRSVKVLKFAEKVFRVSVAVIVGPLIALGYGAAKGLGIYAILIGCAIGNGWALAEADKLTPRK